MQRKDFVPLFLVNKILSKETYNNWKAKFDKVNTSNDLDKEDQLAALYDELEYKFNYLGWSAIEDLLQDKVPETISDLLSANIKLWILTGDKQETAIEIGKSWNLINEEKMELIIMSSKSKNEFIKILTHHLLNPPK